MGLTMYLSDSDAGGSDYVSIGIWTYDTVPYYAEGGSTWQPGAPAADAGNLTNWGMNNNFRAIGDALVDLDARILAIDEAAWNAHVGATFNVHGVTTPVVGLQDVQQLEEKTLYECNDISIKNSKAYHIGASDADGSWRHLLVGGEVEFQERVAGVWTKRGNIVNFDDILSWVPVVKNAAGTDITHLIESARYIVAGKVCFYWFFLRYNLPAPTSYLKVSLPVSAEPGTAGYESGSGFAADSVYQTVYSLLNVSLSEVQVQRYDGAQFTATGVRVLGMSGSYEID